MHFSFDLTEGYSKYQRTDSDTENYHSMWRQTHYDFADKNNNVSFGSLNKHYHSSSYWTRCNIGDNVCLNLHNCRSSILMTVSMYNVMIFAQLYTIVSDTKMYK
jgi:hypothetical protein